MEKGIEMGNKPDEHAVTQVLDYLLRHQCPTAQRGEGTSLFSPGPGQLTPDLVAGTFHGAAHPQTFFIDVVTPTGDYVTKALAGAPQSASFFNQQIASHGGWGMNDIPHDLGQPLVGAVRKKATKYSERRAGSPAFGAVAYFDEHSKSGGHLITMLSYLKVLNDTLGPVNERALQVLLEANKTMVVCPVSWDEPLAFLLQMIDGSKPRGVLLVNTHERVDLVKTHEVVVWANKLGI